MAQFAAADGRGLRGKVVLVDFWTYSCINCLRAIPYVRAWAEKYKDQGLVVIGVHSPEFAFEKNIDNVRRAVRDLKIEYPVAIDNAYAIWRAFGNQYWPAHYFIDTEGRIRHHHFGEGDYEESEQAIRALLAEAGKGEMAGGFVNVNASGVEAAGDLVAVQSPETYVGYERTENFASPGGTVRDMRHEYATPSSLQKNQWALGGDWTVESEKAVLDGPSGRIVFRFHARDLHLVLGPGPDGKPVRFKVTIDGEPPGADHGSDTDGDGKGVVNEQRLYQLVRQGKPGEGPHVRDRVSRSRRRGLRLHLRLTPGKDALLSFCRRTRQHRCDTFRIDVEGDEGQRLASRVAPLVHEIERLVDERAGGPRNHLAVDRVGAGSRQDVVESRARAVMRGVRRHPGGKRHAREIEVVSAGPQIRDRCRRCGRPASRRPEPSRPACRHRRREPERSGGTSTARCRRP